MTAQIKNGSQTNSPKPRARKQPRPTLTIASPASKGRTTDGRFAEGNAGGPGNPHARHCARMLALLRASISDEEMVAIIRMLVTRACEGDVSAAKLILSYKLGKPAPAPNPDEIDRDEWEHFQRDTINLQEVQQVLGSLPSRVGNDIARTALPDITQARQDALTSQLAETPPAERKVTKETEVTKRLARKDPPIPNRYSSPGQVGARAQSTIHDQRSTINDSPPIPNRKTTPGRPGKTKPKKVKPSWLQ
jgi:hypothetical protein